MFILGIICLIATGLFWVFIGAVVGAAERRGLSTALLMILLACGVVVACSVVLAFRPDSVSQGAVLSRRAWMLAAGSLFFCGFFDYLMLLVMGCAMRTGPNGVVWTVTQSGVIFPFLFGVCFYSVPLNWFRGIGMASILVALVVNGIAKEQNGPEAAVSKRGNWRLWMFLAFVCCGANQIFSNWPSYYDTVRDGFSAWSRTLWMHIGYLAGFAFSENRRLFRRDYWLQLKDRRIWVYAAVWIVGTVAVSIWLFYRGIDLVTSCGLGAICYPVMVGACLMGFPIYTTLALRERCTRMQWAALAAGVLGILLISL